MSTAETLQTALYASTEELTYAVVDGASCEELLDKLDTLQPEHACLYAGELAPDIQEVAPYLIALPPDHPFSKWFVVEGFGKHWGVFVQSAADLRALRKHFRQFLLVKDPENKTLYFRYYDPRVLRTYLPTCEPEELAAFFGPIGAFISEGVRPSAVFRFTVESGGIKSETLE